MRRLFSSPFRGRSTRTTMRVCCTLRMIVVVAHYPHAVVTTPMDLQTMLKKVKGKNYKSKREFQDDLDLIWSNCFLYNATEVRGLASTNLTAC